MTNAAGEHKFASDRALASAAPPERQL